MSANYWLTNVRLEDGYNRDEQGRVISSVSNLYHLEVRDGRLFACIPASQAVKAGASVIDAKEALLLPGFRDMHIHIDKTFYSGPWKAPTKPVNIFKRISEELSLLPKQLPYVQERAEAMLALFLSNGATEIRSHCNIDPSIGLGNLEGTLAAISNYKNRMDCKIVAFPQHGLLRSNMVSTVREAIRMGANYVGGVDPANVDQNIEKSLHTIVELAVEEGAGIDLHLHDPGNLGLYTMNRLADLTEEAGLQGKVTVSHALALAEVDHQKQSAIAERFVELGIEITSTVPVAKKTIPFPILKEKGVLVSLGDDSITDHWNPFGQGDPLERAGRLAERFGWSTHLPLSETLGFITGGKLTVNAQGDRAWPAVGDDMSAVLVKATSAAEAVAQRAKRVAVLYKGKIVSGKLQE